MKYGPSPVAAAAELLRRQKEFASTIAAMFRKGCRVDLFLTPYERPEPMSWSVSMVGSPENIVKALNAESAKLTGQSKQEFDEALPHMVGLIESNVNSTYPLCLELTANGSATFKDGVKQYASCSVDLKSSSKRLV